MLQSTENAGCFRHISHLRNSLDQGESEAIILAKELGCDILLIDERKGTQIARSNGLATIGLLGVLSMAKSNKHIKMVKSMLGIFSPGQKRAFFRHFSPFFSHVTLAMLLQKAKN